MPMNKRAAEGLVMNKIVVTILVLLVVLSFIVFLTKPDILNWIKNLPAWQGPAGETIELTEDQAAALGLELIGKMVYEQRKENGDLTKHWYVSLYNEKKQLKPTNLYLNYNIGEGTSGDLELSIGGINPKVG